MPSAGASRPTTSSLPSFRGAHVNATLTSTRFKMPPSSERGYFQNLRHETAPAQTTSAKELVQRTTPAFLAGSNAHRQQHLTADMGGVVAARDIIPSVSVKMVRSSRAFWASNSSGLREVDGTFSRAKHMPPPKPAELPRSKEVQHFQAGGAPSLRLGGHFPHLSDQREPETPRPRKASPPRVADLKLFRAPSAPNVDRTRENLAGAHVSSSVVGVTNSNSRLCRSNSSSERVVVSPRTRTAAAATRDMFSNGLTVGNYRPTTTASAQEPYRDGVTTAVRISAPRFMDLGLGRTEACPPILVPWTPSRGSTVPT